MSPLTANNRLPPFPDIQVAPLRNVALRSLESNKPHASQAMFDAAVACGFFYIDLTGSPLGEELLKQSEELYQLQQDFFKLPKDELGRYEKMTPFGLSTRVREVDGQKVDLLMNYNMSREGIVGRSADRVSCPQIITDNLPVLASFSANCRKFMRLLLQHLNDRLELPHGSLQRLHRDSFGSEDFLRFTCRPPWTFQPDIARETEHTDFGSLTMLFNWLGGLQVRIPDDAESAQNTLLQHGQGPEAEEQIQPITESWFYVKPQVGSCLVNIGDCLVKLTAGVLHPSPHRVIPPPPPQDQFQRHSLAYFLCPEDGVILNSLAGGLIDERVSISQDDMTAFQWRQFRTNARGIYTFREGVEKRELVKPN